MRFKGTNTPLPEIVQALNVDALVEGSVHVRQPGSHHNTAREASPEQHFWAESYERDLRDILALQSEVARAIAHEIGVTVTPEESPPHERAPRRPRGPRGLLKGRFS